MNEETEVPKINREEYEILKGLDDKWKWVARDELRNSVYVFSEKPNKYSTYWEDGDMIYEQIDKNLFQFIQWEDDEPYNIRELIEEYERNLIIPIHEHPPTKQYFESPNRRWSTNHNRGTGGYEMPLDDFLDKLKDGGVDTAKLVIEESEETEVRDIKEQLKSSVTHELQELFNKSNPNYHDYEHTNSTIRKIIDQLDEPEVELPAIPKFVAEWLERNREPYENKLFGIGYDLYNNAIHSDVDGWLIENEEKFVRAWLDGYTVEEEQKYVIKLDDGESYLQRYEIDNKNTVTPFRIFGHLKEVAIIFDDKEKAEKVASLVDGEVEETEERK